MDARLTAEQRELRDAAATWRPGWQGPRRPRWPGRRCRPRCSVCTCGDPELLSAYLYSRAQSVMGGTSQIQKNIIAARILGLGA
jgi:hypothetical protein